MKLYSDIWEDSPRLEKKADYQEIMNQLEVLLKDVSYFELPEKVREYFERRFAVVFREYPEALDYVRSVKIDLTQHRAPYGDEGEYHRNVNRFEVFFKGLRWGHERVLEDLGISMWGPEATIPSDRQEQVREKIIEELLAPIALHELTHSLQNYFKQKGIAHRLVAPYPEEEHPEYYQFGEVYEKDPGEIQARDVRDSFSSLRFGWEKAFELDKSNLSNLLDNVVDSFTQTSSLKLSWEIEEDLAETANNLKFSMARFPTPNQLLKLYNKYKKGYDYTKEAWEVREKVLYGVDMLIRNVEDWAQKERNLRKEVGYDSDEYNTQFDYMWDRFYEEMRKKHPNTPFTGQPKRFITRLKALTDSLRRQKDPFNILVGIDKILNVIHDQGPIGVMLIHGLNSTAETGQADKLMETLNTLRDW